MAAFDDMQGAIKVAAMMPVVASAAETLSAWSDFDKGFIGECTTAMKNEKHPLHATALSVGTVRAYAAAAGAANVSKLSWN